MNIENKHRQTITSALLIAAAQYRQDAETSGLKTRLGEQFLLQAAQARELAEVIENGEEVAL